MTEIDKQTQIYLSNPNKTEWEKLDTLRKQTGLPSAHIIQDEEGKPFELFLYNDTIIPSTVGIIPGSIWWSEKFGTIVPTIVDCPEEKKNLNATYSDLIKATSTKVPGVPDRSNGRPNQVLDDQIILQYNEQAVPALCFQFLYHKDAAIQYSAECLLQKLDCKLMRSIVAIHIDIDRCNKDGCIILLASVQALEYFDTIVNHLSTKELQNSVLFALGSYGDKRGIPYLIQYLGVKEEDLGFEAANSLGRIGHYELSLPLLFENMKMAPDNVRKDVIDAIYNIAMEYKNINIDDIVNYLQDPLPEVRKWTASTLREIGDPLALPALKKAARDKNKDVRESVAEAILELSKGQ